MCSNSRRSPAVTHYYKPVIEYLSTTERLISVTSSDPSACQTGSTALTRHLGRRSARFFCLQLRLRSLNTTFRRHSWCARVSCRSSQTEYYNNYHLIGLVLTRSIMEVNTICQSRIVHHHKIYNATLLHSSAVTSEICKYDKQHNRAILSL